jgi:hypothetical protein
VIDQGPGPLDELRLHAIPERLMTDRNEAFPWRSLDREEEASFARLSSSHNVDEIEVLNNMVESDNGQTRYTALGSSQDMMNAAVQRQETGPRDQVVNQIVNEPSSTMSGSGIFDRQSVRMHIFLNHGWRKTECITTYLTNRR